MHAPKKPVSYTNLTLPTNREVYSSVIDVALKNKRKPHTKRGQLL